MAPIIGTLLTGCATKHPGGRADFWTTTSHAETDVIYHGVGFNF